MARKFYTYKDVLNIVKNEGYELISKREEIENDEGKVLTKTNITVWCKNEKHEYYTTTLGHFNNKRRCRQCKAEENGRKKRLTYEYVKTFIEDFGYILLSNEYSNNRDKNLLVWCGNPNHKPYKVSFGNFQTGYRCPYCKNDDISERRSLDRKHVEKEINKIGYKLVDEKNYFGSADHILIECDKGHIYTSTWRQFNNKQRCVICNGNKSKGEEKIKDILSKNKIEYIWNRGYFDDLYGEGGKPLRPDFIIEDKKIWIEYDGIQHFEPVDFAGKGEEWASEQFEKNKKHDNIKDEYAKENKWKLIRIPYWKFNDIENILKEELK